MDVSRHAFAPKRQIQCQENFFDEKTYLFCRSDLAASRECLARCNTARSAPLRLSTHTRVVAHQRHDFRAKAKDS
jgi:hypothetical protein